MITYLMMWNLTHLLREWQAQESFDDPTPQELQAGMDAVGLVLNSLWYDSARTQTHNPWCDWAYQGT